MATKWVWTLLVLVGPLAAFDAQALLMWGMPERIVCPSTAPEEEQAAAKEFQRLYHLATGTELPIVTEETGQQCVFIGRTSLNDLPPSKKKKSTGRMQRSETWEEYLEKNLEIELDELDCQTAAFFTSGWTSPFQLFIVSGCPDSTKDAVIRFFEENMKMTKDESGNLISSKKEFVGWSIIKRVSSLENEPEDGDSFLEKESGRTE